MTSPPAPGALADAAMRRRATTEFDRNLVVIAGAGTGKTALIVERALNLIGMGRETIDRMALITFTEKAAAELRVRLQGGLDRLRRRAAEQLRSPLDPAEDGDRAWSHLIESEQAPAVVLARALEALRGLERAAVSTIHTFCADMLRRYPAEARVDPRFLIDEGALGERIFGLEWTAYLGEELGPGAPRADRWRRALRTRHDLESARALASALASFTLPGEALSAYAAADPARHFTGAREAALAPLQAVRPLWPRCTPKTREQLEWAERLLDLFREEGADGLRSALASLPRDPLDAMGSPGAKLTSDEQEQVKRAFGPARRLLRGLAQVDEEAIAGLHDVAQPLAVRARERRLREGALSFDALLRLSRDLLASPEGPRRQLARRYRTLLVDEFQDTDPVQYEILFYLAEEGDGLASDAYQTRLGAGRLFIVGDPKQSIYRFRGADIAAFRRAVGRIEQCGGDRLALTASFRSPETILGPINALFDGWIGHAGTWEDDDEPPYDPIHSALASPRDPEPRVAIWSIAAGRSVRERRTAEAQAIAAWIAERAGATADGAPPLRYGDTAILLRALTDAGIYAQALRRAGIPFVVDGGKDFYERVEVGDMLALLRAVASPNDAPSMLAVMRSALGAVPDADLARFAASGGRLGGDSAGRNQVDLPAVRRVFELVERLRRSALGRPADEVIEEILTTTPLAFLHAATHEGSQRLANLRKLASLAAQRAREGLSLAETIQMVESEFESDRRTGESPLADESIDAVRLLSIHKAKGLEYPVVLIPDLGRRVSGHGGRNGDLEAAWLADPAGDRIAIRLADGRSNLAWVLREWRQHKRAEAEEKRVFYVACTRARDRLIFVNSLGGPAAAWRDRLAVLGYRAGSGDPQDEGPLAGGTVWHRREAGGPTPSVAEPAPDLDRLLQAAEAARQVAARAAARARPPIRWPSGTRPEDQIDLRDDSAPHRTSAREADDRRQVAQLAGVAVHASLESWRPSEAGPASGGEALLAEGRRQVERLAAEAPADSGGEARLRDAVIAETADILSAFLRSSLSERLRRVEVLGREVPILIRDGEGSAWTGACDLVFRDDGDLVVADYKTDLIQGDAEVAAAAYREQLSVYIRALQSVFPQQRARGEIWFLRTGEAVRLGA